MYYDKFFDDKKYKTIKKAKKDFYLVETVMLGGDSFFKITEPNGNVHHQKLNYEPICGVDMLDDGLLCEKMGKLIEQNRRSSK